MAGKIQIKRSTGTAAPSALDPGEIAYSEAAGVGSAGIFYVGTTGGAVVPVGGAGHFAVLASPAFSGNPTAPTQSSGDNSTRLATTAFVKAQGYAVASGVTGGTYTKVTVNSSGVVTAGATLDAADIPTLTASKISDFDTQVRTSRVDQMAAPTGSLSLNNQKIVNLADPSSDLDGVNLRTLMARINGMDNKANCRIRINTNINVAGGAPNTAQSLSLAANNRILLTGQTNAAENGPYVIQILGTGSNGTWVRATDADIDAEVTSGLFVWISEGTYANTGWTLTTPDTIILGTTALTFQQTAGAGSITVGSGMGQDGVQVYVKIGASGSPAGSSYAAGGLVYCATSSTLDSAVLDGIVRGNGTGAPTAVTGTANTVVKWGTAGKTLANSLITDDGTTVTVAGNLMASGSRDIGSLASPWNTVNSVQVRTTTTASSGGQIHYGIYSGTSLRWGMGFVNSESSGNAGSDFAIWQYADNGTFLSTAMFISRATGKVGFGTSNPSTRVHVQGALLDGTHPVNMLAEDSAAVATNIGGGIGFGYKYDGTNLAIGAAVQGAKENATSGNYATALRFFTRVNGSNMAEVARLSSGGLYGLGTTNPQGVIDLGDASVGRSMVWGGTNGASHYAGIGTSYSSSALAFLTFLKLNPAADQYLVSWTGTVPHTGVRMGGAASGDIRFFTETATARSAGDVFDYAAATKWVMRAADGGFSATGPVEAGGAVTSALRFEMTAAGSAGSAFSANGQLKIYATSASGLVLTGRGSSNDFILLNKNGDNVAWVTTATQTLSMTAGFVEGLLTVNPGTTEAEAVKLDIAALAVAGTRNSHWQTWVGRSHDGSTAHTRQWREYVAVTNNAGNSEFRLATKLDAGAWSDKVAWDQDGKLVTGTVDGGTY